MNTVRAAILVALAFSGVSCNDLRVGTSFGRIVFNETIQASPAIWRQSQQVTINVTDQEIISSVEVIDNREGKDGEATIIEGGEGKQKVTIELKSPTVFRGFDFHVTVYAALRNFPTNDGQLPSASDFQHPAVNDVQRPAVNDVQHPTVTNVQQAETNVQHPAVNDQQAVTTKDIEHNSTKPENHSVSVAPTTEKTPTDLPRKSRNTEQPDPVVQLVTKDVSQSTTEVPKTTKTDDSSLKVAPVDVTPKDLTVEGQEQAFFTNVKDFDVKTSSTGVPVTTSSTTEKTHEKMVQQNFDSISKELGQKVVFGIRRH